MVERLFDDLVPVPARWQYIAGVRQGALGICLCSTSAPHIHPPVARIHGSRDHGLELGVTPLAITSSNLPANFLLSVPATLCSAGLEVFVPRGGFLPPRDTQ